MASSAHQISAGPRRRAPAGSLVRLVAVLAASALAAATTLKSASAATSEPALSFLLFAGSQPPPSGAQEAKLAALLHDTNHSHASDTVDLQLAHLAWRRMREHALDFARQRADQVRPAALKLLEQAQVSPRCRQSLEHLLERLGQLDEWAVRMFNSFGDLPAAGLFEGSLTSMGSYQQCVDVGPNEWIGNSQYCTFRFQPVVPQRPKFHNILAPIEKLANFSQDNADMFHFLATKSQYFYYTKLRLGTCMPDRCDIGDLEQLAKQVSTNTYLQFAGVSCLQKETGFRPDGAQVFAIAVLVGFASVSLLGTLVHVLNLRGLLVRGQSAGSGSGKSRGHLTSNQVRQQQALLAGGGDQKSAAMLAAPLIEAAAAAAAASMTSEPSSDSKGSTSIKLGADNQEPVSQGGRMLRLVDVLLHFSIIRNGAKFFDTTTSARATTGPAGDNAGPRQLTPSDAATSSSSEASSLDGRPPPRATDIGCVHGLRFWTISWIIFGHTMQYTEWAAFGRAFQVEQNIVSFYLQPLLNATFSVDTFFLISGLLTTYVTWSITRGQSKRFNRFAFLISRYLRLTPQVMLVILMFIAFPLLGDGPYWRGLVQKESDNCRRNWWVNALYLQSFYRQDQICNLVTWWLSIEMFYHFVSILVILALLHSARRGVLAALALGGSLTAVSAYLHYANHYPPNMLPTLLQRYEIWDSIVLKYFWTPYPHAPAYFVGLMLGYVLYNRSITQLTRKQVRYGWTLFAISYLVILFGTYNWNNNAPYSRITSTVYYNLSQIFWALATGWAILACALGHGGWVNDFLSAPVFIPLGRATYMTYLSHMLIVMAYPAKMHLLIEPSYTVFLYIFISNLFLAYALGIFLTLVFESPMLHLQKLVVANMAGKFNDDAPSARRKSNNQVVRVSLYTDKQASSMVDTRH